jgi:alkylation response protein AidB-like acyl-CoA dehydrogenase
VDFILGETQQAVAQAAAHALDRSPPLPPSAAGERDDRALWKELGQAGLLGWAARAGLLDRPDVRRALARTYASLRINELLNWQVAAAPTVEIADASVTKVYASERLQLACQLLEEIVGRHGDPADEETAALSRWLDIQAKRNTVLTFGGGVNEIQRELIATAGLGLPRVPR